MREFMDYVHSAFYEATGWRRDNSYAALNSTTDGELSPIPSLPCWHSFALYEAVLDTRLFRNSLC
jgi:hypothetical protein